MLTLTCLTFYPDTDPARTLSHTRRSTAYLSCPLKYWTQGFKAPSQRCILSGCSSRIWTTVVYKTHMFIYTYALLCNCPNLSSMMACNQVDSCTWSSHTVAVSTFVSCSVDRSCHLSTALCNLFRCRLLPHCCDVMFCCCCLFVSPFWCCCSWLLAGLWFR